MVLLHRPFVLLRFKAPEYEMTTAAGSCAGRSATASSSPARAARATATWRSTSAAARADRPGYATVHVEVEVANFYPALATWVARWFYANTQSRIHVLVTHGFLRSLARLELEESAVGRFAPARATTAPAPHAGEPPVNVGDTPWLAWAGIAAARHRRLPVPALRAIGRARAR